jgi:hypothetical protein
MNFKIKNTAILLFISIVLLTACEKTITIPQPPYDSRVSIQCGLEVGQKPVLYFYKTMPYFDTANLSHLFVKGATVEISNSNTTDSLSMDSTYNYLKCEYEYFYHGHIPIEARSNYQLTILYNKEKFNASTTTNLSAVTIDSVGYESQFKDIYGEHEGVIPYFHDLSGQTNYYRYEMARFVDTTMKYREGKIHSPCIGGSTVPILELGRSVYSNLGNSSGQISFVIEPAYSHSQGLQGSVRIQSIDKATYDFYYQLDRQKLSQLNPFVEPIFLTDGQFGKQAIGYFGSIIRSEPEVFTFPE